VCIATAALIAGSATGTGGLAALAVFKFSTKNGASQFPVQPKSKEDEHGQHNERD
jgi:hypothetical protein